MPPSLPVLLGILAAISAASGSSSKYEQSLPTTKQPGWWWSAKTEAPSTSTTRPTFSGAKSLEDWEPFKAKPLPAFKNWLFPSKKPQSVLVNKDNAVKETTFPHGTTEGWGFVATTETYPKPNGKNSVPMASSPTGYRAADNLLEAKKTTIKTESPLPTRLTSTTEKSAGNLLTGSNPSSYSGINNLTKSIGSNYPQVTEEIVSISPTVPARESSRSAHVALPKSDESDSLPSPAITRGSVRSAHPVFDDEPSSMPASSTAEHLEADERVEETPNKLSAVVGGSRSGNSVPSEKHTPAGNVGPLARGEGRSRVPANSGIYESFQTSFVPLETLGRSVGRSPIKNVENVVVENEAAPEKPSTTTKEEMTTTTSEAPKVPKRTRRPRRNRNRENRADRQSARRGHQKHHHDVGSAEQKTHKHSDRSGHHHEPASSEEKPYKHSGHQHESASSEENPRKDSKHHHDDASAEHVEPEIQEEIQVQENNQPLNQVNTNNYISQEPAPYNAINEIAYNLYPPSF